MANSSLVTKIIIFSVLLAISAGYYYAYFNLPVLLALPVLVGLAASIIPRPQQSPPPIAPGTPSAPISTASWYWPLILILTAAALAGIYFFPFTFLSETWFLSTTIYLAWSIVAALITTIRICLPGEQHPHRYLLVHIICQAALYGVLINLSYFAIPSGV